MNKNNPYERKKQPERVRSALLAATSRIAAEHGLAAVTVDAIAKAAGITKGGLFHHFPSKEAILRAAFMEMIERFDNDIGAAMEADPNPSGRFTRAYVKAALNNFETRDDDRPGARPLSMLADTGLQRCWSLWLEARLREQGDHDNEVRFEIVRLAVDGIWLALHISAPNVAGRFAEVRERLLIDAAPSS